MMIVISRLPRTFGSRNDDVGWVWFLPYRDCHEPSVLAMTVWARCGGCHTEIATAFSKPRNDSFIIAMIVWGHCLPS